MNLRRFDFPWSKIKSEEGFLTWGRCPQTPGIYRLPARMAVSLGRLAPPRHSGRWVGARVASLRCPILRPGEASINREMRRKKKNSCQKCHR